MKVVIKNANDKDTPVIGEPLYFLFPEERPEEGGEGEGAEEGGGGEWTEEEVEGEIKFNLSDPSGFKEIIEEDPEKNPEETPSIPEENPETIFGYSITLKEIPTNPTSPLEESINKSCTFYYDYKGGENFPIYLKINKKTHDQIDSIDSNYNYEIFWKKILDPSILYIYKKDQKNYLYYTEKKNKIAFDSTITGATFTKESQILNLTNLDNEENFFVPELNNLEIIGFEKENSLNEKILQTIPLNSKMIFSNDTEKYIFSLVAEEKEKIPLDFFIKNIDITNGENPPSGGGGDGTEEGGTGGDGTEEGV